MSGFKHCLFAMEFYWTKIKILRENDRGMTTETMVLAGLLTAAAIAAIALIRPAIENRAGDIAEDVNP